VVVGLSFIAHGAQKPFALLLTVACIALAMTGPGEATLLGF
jgi:hypothetical protein